MQSCYKAGFLTVVGKGGWVLYTEEAPTPFFCLRVLLQINTVKAQRRMASERVSELLGSLKE